MPKEPKPEPTLTVSWARGKNGFVLVQLIDYYVNHRDTWQPFDRQSWYFNAKPKKGFVEHLSVPLSEIEEALKDA